METNLILAPGDSRDYDDRVDEALVGVMVADGPNLAPLGRREVDKALTETVWNDEEGRRANVRLMNDSDIPAQWIAVETDDAALLQTLVDALRSALPVQDYETIREAASRMEPGAHSRLALTHASDSLLTFRRSFRKHSQARRFVSVKTLPWPRTWRPCPATRRRLWTRLNVSRIRA